MGFIELLTICSSVAWSMIISGGTDNLGHPINKSKKPTLIKNKIKKEEDT